MRSLLVLVLATAVAACDSRGASGHGYALTDADRAALIQAGRAINATEDPSTYGSPELAVTYRNLAQHVEAGEVGVTWPTFRADLARAAGIAKAYVRLSNDHVQSGGRALEPNELGQLDRIANLKRALEGADLRRAQAVTSEILLAPDPAK